MTDSYKISEVPFARDDTFNNLNSPLLDAPEFDLSQYRKMEDLKRTMKIWEDWDEEMKDWDGETSKGATIQVSLHEFLKPYIRHVLLTSQHLFNIYSSMEATTVDNDRSTHIDSDDFSSDDCLDYLDADSDNPIPYITSENFGNTDTLHFLSSFVETLIPDSELWLTGPFYFISIASFFGLLPGKKVEKNLFKQLQKVPYILMIAQTSCPEDEWGLILTYPHEKLPDSIKFDQSEFSVLQVFKPNVNLLEIYNIIHEISPNGSICTRMLSIVYATKERHCIYLKSKDAWLKFFATLDDYFRGTKTLPFQDYTRYHQRLQQINEMKLSANITQNGLHFMEDYIVSLITFNEFLNNLYSGIKTKSLKTQGKDHTKALVDPEENDSNLVNRKIEKKEKRSYQKRAPWWKEIKNKDRRTVIELKKEKRGKQLQKEGK